MAGSPGRPTRIEGSSGRRLEYFPKPIDVLREVEYAGSLVNLEAPKWPFKGAISAVYSPDPDRQLVGVDYYNASLSRSKAVGEITTPNRGQVFEPRSVIKVRADGNIEETRHMQYVSPPNGNGRNGNGY